MAVVTVPEAKAHLNIQGAAQDGDIQGFIDVAEAVIAHHVGPLEPVSMTATVAGGGRSLVLPTAPVISVESVTPHEGTELDSTLLLSDLAVGVVSYYDGGWFGDRQYVVEFTAGRDVCPPDLLLAVKELLRHLWKTQRGGTRRPGSADEGTPPAAFMLPNRVVELLAPHMQVSVA